LINEAQTYANGILPKSRGRAARILEEARGYKSKVISKSEGEASQVASFCLVDFFLFYLFQ
jgi:membrane protease subunit HflK